MITLELEARAKLNLTMDVLGKRPDGYHNVKSIMQSVSLCDRLKLSLCTGLPWRVENSMDFLPTDDSNLAVKAARLYFERTGIDCGGLSLSIEKNIPVCSGMAGGSSDGAAVLRGLNGHYGALDERELFELASRVGTDVAYCLAGGTMLAEGRGCDLTPLPPLPICTAVIVKPGFSVSTPALFAAIDCDRLTLRPDTDGAVASLREGSLHGVARRLFNVFEAQLGERRREVESVKSALIDAGALGACMTGTGSAVFGLFEDEDAANRAYITLKQQYSETFIAKTV